MNKTELVDKIAEKSGLTKKDSEKALNAIINSVEEALINNDKVQLIGFGSFEVKQRAARKGRNPQTMEEIDIPESKVASFKAGKDLKERLNS